MPLKLNACGQLIRQKLDALSEAEARDPEQVAKAMGDAVEEYIATWAQQLTLTIPPTPGLGITTTPGNPTGPGAPAILPGAIIFS